MGIEGFEAITSNLVFAKELHDIDRFDIVEQQFFDVLELDSYYENMLGIISSIFVEFDSDYSDDDETEHLSFKDDVISGYFVHAWEYGKIHNLHFNQNPHVDNAQNEARRWLNAGCCVDWKLLAYIKTKKAAQQSKLIVRMYSGCGNCSPYENVAYGLIQLYTWFKDKCAEFEALKAAQNKPKEGAPAICVRPKYREVMAA